MLNNLGGLAYLDGSWDEALTLLERARQTFKKIGDEAEAAIAAVNIAEILSDQGRTDEAEPLFREGLQVRRVAGIRSTSRRWRAC